MTAGKIQTDTQAARIKRMLLVALAGIAEDAERARGFLLVDADPESGDSRELIEGWLSDLEIGVNTIKTLMGK